MIDDIIRFAYGKMDLPQQKDITFQNPGEKKIWSLDFSSNTAHDFPIAIKRTLNSQISARISIDSKLISYSVSNLIVSNEAI